MILNGDNQNDGFLSGSEIEQLSLNGQMIFLSSCESGAGQYLIGEGISSIARSFLSAGASEVIATLWKVNDQNIYDLSTQFYKYYFNDMNPSKAAFKAQELLTHESPIIQYPLIYIRK